MHTFGSKDEMDTARKTRELLYIQVYENPGWLGRTDSSSLAGTPMGETASGTSATAAGTKTAAPESRGLPDLAPGQQVKLEHKDFVPVKGHDAALAKPYGDVLDAPLN